MNMFFLCEVSPEMFRYIMSCGYYLGAATYKYVY